MATEQIELISEFMPACVSSYPEGHYLIRPKDVNQPPLCIIPQAIGGKRDEFGRNAATQKAVKLVISAVESYSLKNNNKDD